MLTAMRLVVPMSERDHEAAQAFVHAMLLERQQALASDHPMVELFWERFDYIVGSEPPGVPNPIDHSRTAEIIAMR